MRIDSVHDASVVAAWRTGHRRENQKERKTKRPRTAQALTGAWRTAGDASRACICVCLCVVSDIVSEVSQETC